MERALVLPVSNITDEKLLELVKFFDETLGFCPNSVKTMFHRPEIAYAFVTLNKAVMANKGNVTSGLKRLIGYVSSNATGCRYCQAHTIRAAERYETTQEQLDNIWDFRTHSSFSDAEKIALEFSIAASLIPNSVTDEIAKEMRNHWTEGEIVEILGVVSLFGYLNRWNDSMGTELEEGAIVSGEKLLSKDNWSVGKHGY